MDCRCGQSSRLPTYFAKRKALSSNILPQKGKRVGGEKKRKKRRKKRRKRRRKRRKKK
jgi:hypothetical protein